MIIYGKNTHNSINIDTIYIKLEPYYDFSQIKDKIQQYDYIIFLNDILDYDEQNIIKLIQYSIENNIDEIILNNSHPISFEIKEFDYYKKIIKLNKIFKNLMKEDIKQKNQPNNYEPFWYTLQSSLIRIKNFILPDFNLKKNSHIENLYWTKLLKNGWNWGELPFPPTPPCSLFKIASQNTEGVLEKEIADNMQVEAWGGKEVTIVTGFLDIKIKRPAKSDTPNQTYDYIEKSHGTLQIPQYMVIYCSEGLLEQVYKIREESGLLNKTKIIKITLENDLYMADKLNKIRENVAKNNPPYDIPEYILAVNSRYGYIQNAIENNYFNTDYFAWVDFSASHIVNIPPNKIIEPKSYDKVRIGWIARYSNNQFIYNHHCLGGGIFAGHKEIMMELIKLHHLEFIKLTEMGYNINDDKLLFLIMEQNPYLFDTFFSDYKNLFIRL
jgi:hypothetical protein